MADIEKSASDTATATDAETLYEMWQVTDTAGARDLLSGTMLSVPAVSDTIIASDRATVFDGVVRVNYPFTVTIEDTRTWVEVLYG